jgi:hypothetical protein
MKISNKYSLNAKPSPPRPGLPPSSINSNRYGPTRKTNNYLDRVISSVLYPKDSTGRMQHKILMQPQSPGNNTTRTLRENNVGSNLPVYRDLNTSKNSGGGMLNMRPQSNDQKFSSTIDKNDGPTRPQIRTSGDMDSHSKPNLDGPSQNRGDNGYMDTEKSMPQEEYFESPLRKASQGVYGHSASGIKKEDDIQRENLQKENFKKEKFHKFPGKGLTELLKAREGSMRLPTSTQYRKNNLKILKDTEGS